MKEVTSHINRSLSKLHGISPAKGSASPTVLREVNVMRREVFIAFSGVYSDILYRSYGKPHIFVEEFEIYANEIR